MKIDDDAAQCKKLVNTFVRQSLYASFQTNFLFFKENELSHSQIYTIHLLYHKGSARVSSISKILSISKPAASQLLDQLVSKGFVERCENPADRRIRLHKLSEYGLDVMKNHKTNMTGWVEDLVKLLEPDEICKVTNALTILNEKFKNVSIFDKKDSKTNNPKNGDLIC